MFTQAEEYKSVFLGPNCIILAMAAVLIVYHGGYGLAWLWSKLRSINLTDQMIEVAIFVLAVDMVYGVTRDVYKAFRSKESPLSWL